MYNKIMTSAKEKGQFYTKQEVAKKCVDLVFNEKIINNNCLFLEPSAGYGCFYEEVNRRGKKIVGFDIEPKNKNIKKIDFLKEFNFRNFNNRKVVVIGNPPFGKKSKMAIEFFNRSGLFAETICFILPNQFKKYSTHSKLDKNFKLIKSVNLEKNSFYTEEKPDYNVNCVFQIWTKLETPHKNLRILDKPKITHKDFEMYQYNSTEEALKIFENDFDFGIFSQGYGDYKKIIHDRKDFDKKKQYILFKAKNKKTLQRLKNLDFEKLSRNNTTIHGFRKHDVVSHYISLFR